MGIFDTSFYIFHFALHIPLIGSINLLSYPIEYFRRLKNQADVVSLF